MSRRRISMWMITWTFFSAWAVAAHAQLPDGCTSADRQRVATYTNAAVEALMQYDDTEAYVGLSREMDAGLSKTCRAALDRELPTRKRCTSGERKLILDHYEAMIFAALQGNVPRIFALFDNLEASVSRTCWLAANQHDDPGVRRTCSAGELDVMASYAGPMVRAIPGALATNDVSQVYQLAQELDAQLSRACSQAVAEAQRRRQLQPPPNPSHMPFQPPGVNDHGGGTLSAPGIGACTPGGCMAF